MTCIVGVKHGSRVLIAGDSFVGSYHRRIPMYAQKVFRRDESGMIFGTTGSRRSAQILRHVFKIPEHKPTQTTIEYLVGPFIETLRRCNKDRGLDMTDKDGAEFGNRFLLGYRGRLFQIDIDYQVNEGDYFAIGSGADFARAVLFYCHQGVIYDKRAMAKQALEVSIALCPTVEPPIYVEELNGRDDDIEN